MALTDAQQKIIDEEKRKKDRNKQKAAGYSNTTVTTKNKLSSGSQLSPLDLARKDSATGTTIRDKITFANQSKATDPTNVQNSIRANQERQEARRKARSELTLSEADMGLPSLSQKGILDAKLAWEEAKNNGDRAGMDKAHADAERIRSRYGYSGGKEGTEKIEGPGLSQKDKVTLNKQGQNELLSALARGDTKRAEEVRKAKGFQAVDYSVQRDSEGREIFSRTKEEKERDGDQFMAGLEASAKGFAGSLLSVHETFNQAMRNYNRDRWGRNLEANANQTKDEALAEASREALEGATIVDPMLPGQRLLRESQEASREALEGKTGLEALLIKAGISGAQMAPGIAASFIPGVGPALGLGLMGAQAAGSKMGELNEQSSNARMLSYMMGGDPKDYGEVTPQEAFTRGIISGGIEALTERLPLKNLVDIVKKSGGASALVSIAKQMGYEATEESASYVLNYAADVLAEDPNARFSLKDLAEGAAIGAISGAGFAAGGTAINSAIGKKPAKTGQDILLEAAGIKPRETAQNEPEQMFEQPQQETPATPETPAQGQERGEVNNNATEEEFDPANIPRDAINKRKNEPGGWGKYYQNTTEMLFDHLREVNPELSSVVDAEADSQRGPFPAINAVVATSNDVRQDKITPAAAIQFLSDTYKNGGVAGLEALYNPGTGNLTPESLEAMKEYEALEPGEVTEEELRAEFEAMGAASEGFDPYTNAMNKYGTIDPGENPARIIDVPKSTDGTDRVSKFARNILEAEVTTEPTIKRVEKMIMDQGFSYKPKKDRQSLEKAINVIESYGIDPALAQWQEVVDGRRSAGKDDIVLAETLYINAERTGDTELAAKLAAEIAAEGTRMGQGIQALRLLKKATKEGRVYYIRKSVEYVKQELQGRMGDKAKDISIPDELIQEYMDAQGKAAEDEVLDKIYTRVAEQIPPTLNDRITAWRYFAMLGNPKTHLKNMLGNILFGGLYKGSNQVSALMQRAALAEADRTRSLLKDDAARDFAKADWEENKGILSGDKYNSAYTSIQRKVQENSLGIFNRPAKFSSDKMNQADTWAKKGQYISSMARFITARGWDPANLTKEQLETARSHAILDAQRATFTEASDLADTLSKLEQKGKAWNVAIGATMPFKGVPINIAKQGFNFSAPGLLKSLTYDLYKVKKGERTAAEAIDHISQGLTGTSIAALGFFLASQGILNGMDSDDEKERLLDEASGEQEYSLDLEVLGDKLGLDGPEYTYTIDWMAPAVLPLFFGAEVYQGILDAAKELGEDDFPTSKAFEIGLNAVVKTFEPMMNMTVVSGISDVIRAAAFNQNNAPVGIATEMVEGFMGQFVPTFLGQIARTIDDTRRSTFGDKNKGFAGFQEFIQQQGNKIPGLSQKNIPYLNVWGETDTEENDLLRAFENFISPGYIAKKTGGSTEAELKRLHEAGYEGVLPGITEKSAKVNDKYVTADQWLNMQTTRGQTAKSVLDSFIGTEQYNSLSDDEKAKFVKDVLELSSDAGKVAGGGTAMSGAFKDAIVAGYSGERAVNLALSRDKYADSNNGLYEFVINQASDYAEQEKLFNAFKDKGTTKTWAELSKEQAPVSARIKTAKANVDSVMDADRQTVIADAVSEFGTGSRYAVYQGLMSIEATDEERRVYYEYIRSQRTNPWKASWAQMKANGGYP